MLLKPCMQRHIQVPIWLIEIKGTAASNTLCIADFSFLGTVCKSEYILTNQNQNNILTNHEKDILTNHNRTMFLQLNSEQQSDISKSEQYSDNSTESNVHQLYPLI